jgi:ribosome-binding ATPase YchF (GTP1/OBG family)
VVRCFDDDNVIHVAGKVDPMRDIEVIETELALADLATVERPAPLSKRPAKSGDKEAKRLVAVLESACPARRGQAVRAIDLAKEEWPRSSPCA